MKFRKLVLEGNRNAEKEQKEKHLPAYTKSDYLRRKRLQSQPPLHARSFYITSEKQSRKKMQKVVK